MGRDSSTRLASIWQVSAAVGVWRGRSEGRGAFGQQPALALPTLVTLGLAAAFHRTKSFAAVLVLTVKLLEDSQQWKHSPLAAAREIRGGVARTNDPSTIREVAIQRP